MFALSFFTSFLTTSPTVSLMLSASFSPRPYLSFRVIINRAPLLDPDELDVVGLEASSIFFTGPAAAAATFASLTPTRGGREKGPSATAGAVGVSELEKNLKLSDREMESCCSWKLWKPWNVLMRLSIECEGEEEGYRGFMLNFAEGSIVVPSNSSLPSKCSRKQSKKLFPVFSLRLFCVCDAADAEHATTAPPSFAPIVPSPNCILRFVAVGLPNPINILHSSSHSFFFTPGVRSAQSLLLLRPLPSALFSIVSFLV
ncbi:hypothetical protein Mapa_011452 [Marchantia paleacea]|nr:hypothetical protein Mapa_011452 [Marchantia paleacea]